VIWMVISKQLVGNVGAVLLAPPDCLALSATADPILVPHDRKGHEVIMGFRHFVAPKRAPTSTS